MSVTQRVALIAGSIAAGVLVQLTLIGGAAASNQPRMFGAECHDTSTSYSYSYSCTTR